MGWVKLTQLKGLLLCESSFFLPMTVSYTLTSGERPPCDARIVWEFTHTADSGLVGNAKGVPNMYKVKEGSVRKAHPNVTKVKDRSELLLI